MMRCAQAIFGPMEQLSELRALVGRLLQPGISRWQLYTAPPKQVCVLELPVKGAQLSHRSVWRHQSNMQGDLHMQVIKDWSQTLYSAGFVPAAHVYFSSAADPAHPVLRQEVLGSVSAAPVRQLTSHSAGSEAAAAQQQQQQQQPADRSARGASSSGQTSSQIKKPKWLKVGK